MQQGQTDKTTSDEIRDQIVTTRAALMEKADLLHSEVTSKVDEAKEVASDAIEKVRKEFSLRYQYEQYPWQVLLVTVASGMAVGGFLGRPEESTSAYKSHRFSGEPRTSSRNALQDAKDVAEARRSTARPASPRRSTSELSEQLQMIPTLASEMGWDLLKAFAKNTLPASLVSHFIRER